MKTENNQTKHPLNHFTILFRQYFSVSLINRGMHTLPLSIFVSNLAESISLFKNPSKAASLFKHPHLLPLNLSSSFLPNTILNNIESKGNKYMEE